MNVTTRGADSADLPPGFFISVGATGNRSLGFYCPVCKFSVRYGAHVGIQHCGKHEMPPAEPGQGPNVGSASVNYLWLPEVHWEPPSGGNSGAAIRVGNNTIVDTDNMPGTFDGEFEYEMYGK